MTLNEGSLHKWFSKSKSKDGKKGWVNVVTGGTCASDKPGEGTPKCVSSSKRASMTKAERLSAQRRKKAADPNQQSKSGAAKPTYVRTDSKKKMKESKDVTAVAKELDKASKMHKGQAEKLRKHADSMKKPSKIDEKCWVGYTQKGMKKKGKKMVPNCVPVNEVAPPTDKHERMVKHIKKNYKKDGKLTKDEKSIAYATAWKNYNKEDWKPEIEHSKLGDAKKKKDKERESKLPPHLQGDALGKMKKAFASEDYYSGTGEKVVARTKKYMDKKGMKGAPGLDAMKARTADHKAKRGVKEEVVAEADKKGKGSGKKDACYHKVKASAKVWPSAYASGRLVQCRKKGAANYGNKSEEVQVEGAAWTKKSGKNKSGGLNEKGRKSYERENPGSDLKAPSKKVGNPRRKSFCARMKGMKKKLTSAKTARDPDSRINKSLRAWNCGYEPQGQMIESTKHGVDGEKYLKLPKKYEKLAKDKSDYRSALGKAKDAVTDKLGKTNTDRDGVKDSSKKLFTMQNGYEPQGDIIEGINFAAFRKKSADVKKKPEKAMDAGAKARRSMQRREYAKTVSGSTDRVPKDLED